MRIGWWLTAALLMLVAGGGTPLSLAAQEADAPAADPDDNGSSLIPFPVIFYQPETGFGFGASAVFG